MAMVDRDKRLKVASRESQRCSRNLKKDRADLDRKEKKMMITLRSFVKDGDLPKAKILATQLAHFRLISDRNFSRSCFIETETQMRISNHKINQAHIEFLKGMKYANAGESIESVKSRERKYHQRQDEHEAMEELMNEGMQDVFDEQESERKNPEYFDMEIGSILREAADANNLVVKKRDYSLGRQDFILGLLDQNVLLNVKIFQKKSMTLSDKEEIAINIPTIDMSITTLINFIIRDPKTVKSLGMELLSMQIGPGVSGIQLGDYDYEEMIFEPFKHGMTLKKLGITEGDTIFLAM